MRGADSLQEMNSLMAAEGLSAVESFALAAKEDDYRNEFGILAYDLPGIFAFGNFEVARKGGWRPLFCLLASGSALGGGFAA